MNSILVRLFERATGSRASQRTADAVSRFGPYLAGMVVAKGLSTGGQLLLSRWLGPAEFGQLAIVLSISTLVALPLAGAWGSTFARYAAGRPDDVAAPLLVWIWRRTVRSVLIVALALAALTPLLAPLLRVPSGLVLAGAGLGLGMALWLLAKSASQGREDWRRFVGSEAAFGATIGIAPLLLAIGGAEWWKAALAFLVAYVLGALCAWKPVRAAWRSARTAEVHDNAVARYGQFALLTGIANTVYLYADRFAVQHVLGFTEVGIYQVYNFATLGVALLLSTMLYNFVFPLFPQGDRRAFASLFRNGYLRLLPLTLIGLFVAGALQIYLTRFPFRPLLLAIATVNAAAFVACGFYGHLVASLGVNGTRLGAKVAATTVVVFIVGVGPAVHLGGLNGLFALYTAISLSIAIFYDQALRRLTSEASDAPITGSALALSAGEKGAP